MSNIIQTETLVFVDVNFNNNKVWEGILYDNGDVETRWGRIAGGKQSKMFPKAGAGFLSSKKASKLKKGYSEAKIVPTSGSGIIQSVPQNDLVSIALSQIKYSNTALKNLITRLAQANIHKICSETNISYQANSQVFSTPIGVISASGIAEARNLLAWFIDGKKVKPIDSEFKDHLNQYLRIIPQKTSHKIRVESFFPDVTAIQKQNDILDALENSLQIIAKPTVAQDGVVKPVESIFKVRLDILDDKAERQRIEKKYYDTRKSEHTCYNLKIKEIFYTEIDSVKETFEKEGKTKGEVKELWHGTRNSGILSILKSGLKANPPSSCAINGRAFSDGLYFASASTKSLNYATGFWTGTKESSVFMFLADVALGKYFVPNRSTSSPPPAGYDSYWAQVGKTSGIINDEFIVPRESQHNLKYLIEFQ